MGMNRRERRVVYQALGHFRRLARHATEEGRCLACLEMKCSCDRSEKAEAAVLLGERLEAGYSMLRAAKDKAEASNAARRRARLLLIGGAS